MNANAYARIAERYLVTASDEEAVERFFLDVAPTLSREEREAIVVELSESQLATSDPHILEAAPLDVPAFSIDEAPAVTQPNSVAQLVGELSAAVERRVSARLDEVVKRAILEMLLRAEWRKRSSGEEQPVNIAELTLADVSVDDTVFTVALRMIEKDVRVVAVREHDRIVGVLSEHDVLTRVVAKGLDPDDTSAAAVMTRVN